MTITPNPFSVMLASLQPDYFVGRETAVSAIIEGVNAAIKPVSFSIYGPRTLGKTSLLKYLAHPQRSLRDGEKSRFIYVDFLNLTGDQMAYGLAGAIFEAMQYSDAALPFRREDIRPDNEISLREELQKFLQDMAGKQRFVFCIDHFDYAYSGISVASEEFCSLIVYLHSFVVASEVPLGEIPVRREGLFVSSILVQILKPRPIDLLSPEASKQLLRVGSAQAGLEFSPSEIEFVVKYMGGNPLLLTLGGEYLFTLVKRNSEYALLRDGFATNKHLQNEIAIGLETSPAITRALEVLDKTAGSQLLIWLRQIAKDAQADSNFGGMAMRKRLVTRDLVSGKYKIFSEIYRRHLVALSQDAAATNTQQSLLDLTPLDKAVFEYLMSRAGQTCSFEELYALWSDKTTSERGLQASIHRIRNQIKLKNIQSLVIESARKQGFRLIIKN